MDPLLSPSNTGLCDIVILDVLFTNILHGSNYPKINKQKLRVHFNINWLSSNITHFILMSCTLREIYLY